ARPSHTHPAGATSSPRRCGLSGAASHWYVPLEAVEAAGIEGVGVVGGTLLPREALMPGRSCVNVTVYVPAMVATWATGLACNDPVPRPAAARPLSPLVEPGTDQDDADD